ncbi:MAG: nitrilase [Firmicutes bacterium]|nr:nitrilase [Bacillota bacterium]
MLEEFSLRFALWWRSRGSGVTAHLARRSYERPPYSPAIGSIRVGAVQMRPRPIRRAWEFADHAYEMARAAVREGAEVVVFPDHVSLPLLTLVPGLGDAVTANASLEEALAALGEAEEPEEGGEGISVADVVAVATPALARVYRTTFATLARRFRVHIAAGSTMLAERDGRVLARCHLFGPSGRLLEAQAKTHLTPLERRWGLGSGDELRVVDTAVGRVALTGTMDSAFFEPFRLLDEAGAEVVLQASAEVGEPEPWRAMGGLWARVQEACLYGVQGALVGEALGLRFGGMAAVYAPLALTPEGDGVLAAARSADADEVVVADLDIGALRQLRRSRGVRRNRRLIGRYLPELYTRPWPWPEEQGRGTPGAGAG